MKKIAHLGLAGLMAISMMLVGPSLPPGLSVLKGGGLVRFSEAVADRGNPTEWRVKAYKIDLVRDQIGISGDVLRREDTGWIHLGSNHLEGGSIRYAVQVGRLDQSDILEIWIDGYSESSNPDVGPTILVGGRSIGQVTRRVGDAWKPKVFRFADDLIYGDLTEPSNRNESWRIRFPSNKYESNRINRDPGNLVGPDGRLPIEIAMTGSDGFIIKRIEVDVYKNITEGEFDRELDLRILDIYPNPAYTGDFVTVRFSKYVPALALDLYIIDPDGYEHLKARNPQVTTNSINFLASGSPFFKTGLYRVRLVFRSNSRTTSDLDSFYFYSRSDRPGAPTPYVESPQAYAPPPEAPYPEPLQAPYPEQPPRGYEAPPYQPLYEPPSPSTRLAPVPRGNYTIQVSANRAHHNAVKLQDHLRRRGYPAYISETYVPGLGHFFRVRVGAYPDRYTAERQAYQLRTYEGLETWVTRDDLYWSRSSLDLPGQAPSPSDLQTAPVLSGAAVRSSQELSPPPPASRSNKSVGRTDPEEKGLPLPSSSLKTGFKSAPASVPPPEKSPRVPEVLAPVTDRGLTHRTPIESQIEEVVWNELTKRSIPGYSYEIKEVKVTGDQAEALVAEESKQGKLKNIRYGLKKKDGRWVVQSADTEL